MVALGKCAEENANAFSKGTRPQAARRARKGARTKESFARPYETAISRAKSCFCGLSASAAPPPLKSASAFSAGTPSNKRFKRNGYKVASAEYAWYNPRRYVVMNQARRFGNICQCFGWAAWMAPFTAKDVEEQQANAALMLSAMKSQGTEAAKEDA